MATNTHVTDEKPEDRFYAPAIAKQSSAPGRIERGLAALLPDTDVIKTIPAKAPEFEFEFYLPGVRIAKKNE